MDRTYAIAFITLIFCFSATAKQSLSNKSEKNISADILVASAYTWMEKSEINREVDNRKFSIDSAMLGAGLSYRQNSIWSGYSVAWELGLITGQVNSESADPQLNYFHRGANLLGLTGGVGLSYRPLSKNVTIGVFIPSIYRVIDFQIPQRGYSFNSKEKLISFISLEMTWKLASQLTLIQRIGAPLTQDKTLWSAALAWRY